jgi:hypothetical protein
MVRIGTTARRAASRASPGEMANPRKASASGMLNSGSWGLRRKRASPQAGRYLFSENYGEMIRRLLAHVARKFPHIDGATANRKSETGNRRDQHEECDDQITHYPLFKFAFAFAVSASRTAIPTPLFGFRFPVSGFGRFRFQ